MRTKQDLQINVPTFFRCPISLDVMKSPVSLSTGVTYDRDSIQRWLDAGNNTCPATMQVLPTTDLIPNHTLHRLIQIWSRPPIPIQRPQFLLRDLASSPNPLPLLRYLSDHLREKHAGADDLAVLETLNSVLLRNGDIDVLEEVVRVLNVILERNGNGKVAKVLAGVGTVAAVLEVVRGGRKAEVRVHAVRVLERIAGLDSESKLLVAGADGVLAGLVEIVESQASDSDLVDATLACLVSISSPRKVRSQMVRVGVVKPLGRILSQPSIKISTAEMALKLLEVASTCTEGRAAICEDACVVTAIIGRMMKVSSVATEHAVVVLWSVCHLFGDRRAQEAVTASNGLTKILLLMQINCSAAARQMAGDLLRIFRVNSKSCLASYDSKTTHIMPF